MKPWEFWIDVGGTFTDCLALVPDGGIRTHKLLSSGVYKGTVSAGSTCKAIIDSQRSADPPGFFDGFTLSTGGCDGIVRCFNPESGELRLEQPLAARPVHGQPYELSSNEEAPITGIRWLMGKRLADEIIGVHVRLGTTKGTNALLERQGARTAFVATAGLGDVLRIGSQKRPKLFQLNIRRHAELYEAVVEIDERIDSNGVVLVPICERRVWESLADLKERGIESLAVCLLNGYRNDQHEKVVERVALELGFEHVSCGITQLQKLIARANTTVVDAYLTPVLRRYVNEIRDKVRHGSLKLMTSAGGLVDAEHFIGKDSILSGPAGGVIGYAHAASQAGFSSR